MKRLILSAAAILLFATQAFAGDIIGQQQKQNTDVDVNQAQGQQQGQLQGQIQGQRQGQGQGQAQDQANTQTTTFKDERQLAPVYVTTPSFGAAVSGNSCAGTEAWSVGVGGAFFVPNGTGAPVSAGVGFGSSDVVTINLCEVREAANLANAMGDHALALQILAQHPAAYRAMQALGRNVKPVPAYNMDVVTEGSQPAEVVTTTTTTRVASNGQRRLCTDYYSPARSGKTDH